MTFTTGPEFDPYHDRKLYHFAAKMDPRGHVSPLCANPPRRLNLKRELWTLRRAAVTCPKCLAKLASVTGPTPTGP